MLTFASANNGQINFYFNYFQDCISLLPRILFNSNQDRVQSNKLSNLEHSINFHFFQKIAFTKIKYYYLFADFYFDTNFNDFINIISTSLDQCTPLLGGFHWCYKERGLGVPWATPIGCIACFLCHMFSLFCCALA